MARRTLAALLAALLLLTLVACGGDDDSTVDAAADPPDTTPEAEAAEGEAEAPARIVSISPTATEMLFAIGAGDQVVAVDDQSDFPEGVPTTDLSGYEPNVEAIVGYDPDLVVLSNDTGDVVAGLEAAGVEPLLLPAANTLEESYEQIELLGTATGHADEAAEVVAGIKADIEELVDQVPERETPLTYYHELDPTFFTATSETFIGEIYGLAGLENIADAADADQSGYPQLSAEYILEQDPDLVFLADTECCEQNAETVADRPGWSELTAVRNGGVVELGDDVASRWGPRVVDLLGAVVAAVAEAPAA